MSRQRISFAGPIPSGSNHARMQIAPILGELALLPNWEHGTFQAAEVLGKQAGVQRCKEANDGVVQLLCIGEMELTSRAEGRLA